MKTSTHLIAAAVAAIALGAGGLAFAHQGSGMAGKTGDTGCAMGQQAGGQGSGARGHAGHRGGESAADVGARLAAVKTELKLSGEQEPAWQQFESLVRQQADARQARRTAMQAQMHAPGTAASAPGAAAGTDRTALREAMMKQHQAEQAASDAARQALYAVLTPEQKALADQRLRGGPGQRRPMHQQAG